MTNYSNKMFFNEKIDGKTVNDFRKLDKSKKTLNERKEILEQKLNSSEFFIKYFDEVYNPNIKSTEALSDSDAVCKALENMGTYLINCEESKELDRLEKETEGNYKIFTRRLEEYTNRENVSIHDFNGDQRNIVESERIEFIPPKDTSNKVKPKEQKITSKDLKEQSELGSILRDYNTFLNVINDKMKQKIDSQWFLLSKNKSSVMKDMIDAKNMIRGVWGYNINPPITHAKSLGEGNYFDFTDRSTIKYLLQMQKPDVLEDLDMWIVWYEFHETISKADLTDEEISVYELLKLGYNFKDIAGITDIDYNRVRLNVFNNICKKIEKVKNRYDANDLEVANKIKERKEKNRLTDKDGGNVKI